MNTICLRECYLIGWVGLSVWCKQYMWMFIPYFFQMAKQYWGCTKFTVSGIKLSVNLTRLGTLSGQNGNTMDSAEWITCNTVLCTWLYVLKEWDFIFNIACLRRVMFQTEIMWRLGLQNFRSQNWKKLHFDNFILSLKQRYLKTNTQNDHSGHQTIFFFCLVVIAVFVVIA